MMKGYAYLLSLTVCYAYMHYCVPSFILHAKITKSICSLLNSSFFRTKVYSITKIH